MRANKRTKKVKDPAARGAKDAARGVTRRGHKFGETARILGVSEPTLRQLVADGHVRVVYLGPRLPIFSDAEIDRVLHEGIVRVSQ
jgi:hypothetical protein